MLKSWPWLKTLFDWTNLGIEAKIHWQIGFQKRLHNLLLPGLRATTRSRTQLLSRVWELQFSETPPGTKLDKDRWILFNACILYKKGDFHYVLCFSVCDAQTSPNGFIEHKYTTAKYENMRALSSFWSIKSILGTEATQFPFIVNQGWRESRLPSLTIVLLWSVRVLSPKHSFCNWVIWLYTFVNRIN